MLAEVNVVAVRSERFAGIGFDDDLAEFDRVENGLVGKDHVIGTLLA